MPTCSVRIGDAEEKLSELPDGIIQCCVTSPPYYGLRDYGDPRQLGSEATPGEYIDRLVSISREIRRVLANDGTFWLNLGDSYYNYRPGAGQAMTKQSVSRTDQSLPKLCARRGNVLAGFKEKDRMMIPARCAIALQADGWYLRDEIVWHKPNPMPESVADRTTKSHEFIYLLTKNKDYYYDAAAIAEPLAYGSIERLNQDVENQEGSDRIPFKTNGPMKAVYKKPYRNESTKDYAGGGAQDASATKARIVDRILSGDIITRNKRSVWTVTTQPCRDAHFATYPPDLIKPCILAGSKAGQMVLDPFGGSGTTGKVALELGRNCILIELNPSYAVLCETNTDVTPGLPL